MIDFDQLAIEYMEICTYPIHVLMLCFSLIILGNYPVRHLIIIPNFQIDAFFLVLLSVPPLLHMDP